MVVILVFLVTTLVLHPLSQGDMPVEDVGIYECKCTIGKLEFIAEGHTKPEAKTAVTEISVQVILLLLLASALAPGS